MTNFKPPSFVMKIVKRFTSFKALKASESNVEAQSVIRKRHRAFEKFMALLRSKVAAKRERK